MKRSLTKNASKSHSIIISKNLNDRNSKLSNNSEKIHHIISVNGIEDDDISSTVVNTKRKNVDEGKDYKRKKIETAANTLLFTKYSPDEENSKAHSNIKFTSAAQIDISSSSNQCDKENQPHISNMDSANLESILNIDFDNWEDETMHESNLDLTQPHRCKIINITRTATKIELTLKSVLSNEKVFCILGGSWVYTCLEIGSAVCIVCKNIQGNWVINNEHGLLIFEPDYLLPTTTLVSSLWCKRRSALNIRFKSSGSSNEHMLVGSLVHSIFQCALENNILDTEVIEKMMDKYVSKDNVIKSLFECNISLSWVKNEVKSYIPKIQEFIKSYVNNSGVNSELLQKKDNWKGSIDDIEDVEENIWCPEFGIKGKIDVTIRTNKRLMPLEIKTGKASISIEHRGQVILYLMMMKKIGYDVSSGLLLYLKEGVLKEISSSEREERDLIHLRNELVYYLMQKPDIIDEKNILLKLPEPINHTSCKTCPLKTICVVYAHFNNEDISSNAVLRQIQQETLEYLSETHIHYFIKWATLNIIESMSNSSTRDMKEIYLTAPEEREKNGKCISNLKLVQTTNNSDDAITEHVFKKSNNDLPVNLITIGMFEGQYIIVSSSKRHAIATGFIRNITNNSVTISLERNISDRYQNEIFCIDNWTSDLGQGYNLNNLALLLESTPKSENLRKIIIDKISPTFKSKLPKEIGIKGKYILRRLNHIQQRAVLKAIAANEYFLIKGMPGTGKTTTIVALIQLFYELKKTVLITSHTNSAVDNVCLKLLKFGVKFMRLGSDAKIHQDLHEYLERNLTKHCTSPEEYEKVFENVQIIATTCMSSGHPVLMKRTLDVCIVDESTQVSQSSIIRPLYACKTFILIGDPDQLPAVIRNQKARNLGMSESLFERLYSETASAALNINYRMNSRITYFANRLTYKDELKIGSEEVARSTIKLPNKKKLQDIYHINGWVMKSLDDSLDNAVQFVDIGQVWNLSKDVDWKVHKKYGKDNSSNVNIHEAAVIYILVKALLEGGVNSNDIGVIASYRHQVEQIASIIKNVDINTVDQFQGKDKSVIIYSSGVSRDTSVCKTPESEDILEDKRRLNVAITRAKHKLIIVGDMNTIKTYSSFKEIVRLCENVSIKIYEYKNFSWDNVLQEVQLIV
ncbi:DNA replication ATP-dependent helicase/nuclease DNA2 [Diorhabda sublineata]|uniref:DNA replication ATP-dependent helicase/nuclease DNA2 n=1 Tax=Diorhabda sublineata TaxID=1163346 RepID=UPI0024E155EE|nr:DNA replication ATP-dependent helicase/nuclease DNA2 [Diorhabda sublineata]